MKDVFEHAQAYLKAGWSIAPCPLQQKHPEISWTEFQRKRPSTQQLKAWDAAGELEAVAIITGKLSGILVVDVDPRKGGTTDGLPPTGCIARTGGGGFHYIYQYPRGVARAGNGTNVKPGIDIRGDGGLILAPPSFHVCTKPHEKNPCPQPCPRAQDQYEWVKFNPKDLGAAPRWAYEEPDDKDERTTTRKRWITDLVMKGSSRGSRDDDTTKLVGYWASMKIPPDVALAWTAIWMEAQDDPLPYMDLERIVESIYKTEKTSAITQFPVLSLSEFMLKHGSEEVKWTITDWLPESTIAFLVSPPAGYKTWWSFDLAASVASGEPFLDKYEVQNPGAVLLIQQEDFAGDIASRNGLVLLTRARIEPPSNSGDDFEAPIMPSDAKIPLYFHTERQLKFNDDKVMESLRAFIIAKNIRLVVIDPLYSAARLDDYLVEASQQMFKLKDIRDETGCSFLIVHHTKKAGEGWDTQNMWGSQFINAFKETIFFVKRAPSQAKIVIQRGFKSAPVMPFTEIEFDIDTKENRYAVTTRDVSAEEAASFTSDSIEDKILTALEKPLTLAELAIATNRNAKDLRRALNGMVKEHLLSSGADGKYRIIKQIEVTIDD